VNQKNARRSVGNSETKPISASTEPRARLDTSESLARCLAQCRTVKAASGTMREQAQGPIAPYER
jgi:hypothetical protein